MQPILSTSPRSGPRSLRLPVALLASALLASACASAPLPPTDALQAAELAIRNAEQARVADYASPELGQARSQLSAAQAAVQQEHMLEGQRLAELSRLSADLATAKAEQVKARQVNEELQKGTDSLRQEMQRNNGATK